MTDSTRRLTLARPALTIRKPTAADGAAVWRLVRDSGALDENSMYCNLLQCTHFAATCAVAEIDGEVVGWLSGYIPPERPDTYFVWQVGVGAAARGRGVARKLILDVLDRDACAGVDHVQSTITADNRASWALFGSIADRMAAPLVRHPHFREAREFDGEHATEHLVTIGPFGAALQARAAA